MSPGDLPNLRLLQLDGQRCIHHRQAEFRNHFFVLVEDAALEEAEAFLRVVAQPQIHARFVEFEAIARIEQAADGGFKRHADPPWIGPQCLQAAATWRQVMIERRLDIAVPEMLTEAETDRQIENNVDIRARLAARRNRGWAELNCTSSQAS